LLAVRRAGCCPYVAEGVPAFDQDQAMLQVGGQADIDRAPRLLRARPKLEGAVVASPTAEA
jgi:hypothetical protein